MPDPAARGGLVKACSALVDYTHYHFAAEEKLMGLYRYSGMDGHAKHHRKLAQEVLDYVERIQAGDVPDKAAFLHFFDSWLVQHILNEDCKYGAFLNEQGVY